jgi:hypothetical protein
VALAQARAGVGKGQVTEAGQGGVLTEVATGTQNPQGELDTAILEHTTQGTDVSCRYVTLVLM